MLVTIDESGDPGFKLDRGSTPSFVLAMVAFPTFVAAERCAADIALLQQQARAFPEFKFSKSRDELRDAFMRAVCDHDFRVRAIVVRKARIRSPALRGNDATFYDFFLRQLMQQDGGLLQDATVKIDSSGDREFKQGLLAYLRKRLDRGQVRKLSLKDSRGDHLIQLADMCAGAIARSAREDERSNARWRLMLRRRIDDVWEFR